MKIIRSSLIGLLLLYSTSCEKGLDNGIPLVTVDITIHTVNPSFFDLGVVGGWTYVTGGSRGILIYRKSTEEFAAFDRHCTFEPNNSCGQVAVDSSNIIATDTCCGSQFLIIDGSIVNGPAALPLKQYRTNFDGSVLRIFN